jgi:hypothetical protein
VPALIAIGEPAYKKQIEACAGDYAELTEFGDSIGQAPVRDSHAHAALNDFGKLHHASILSHIRIIPNILSDTNCLPGREVSNIAQYRKIENRLEGLSKDFRAFRGGS